MLLCSDNAEGGHVLHPADVRRFPTISFAKVCMREFHPIKP